MALRLTRPVFAALALAAGAALLAGCGGSSGGTASSPALADRKVTIGGLSVTVTPGRIDSDGAEFKVVFDTHTGAPEIDVAANAALVVDGTPWTGAAWAGDGPGGHHREGTLSFTAAAPAEGVARLTITGLDGPLEATWNLP